MQRGQKAMSEDRFWRVIATFDWSQAGDDDDVLRPAVRALAAMTQRDIFAFDDLLAQKLFALDTRAHARGAYRGQLDPDDGDAYISADDFLYLRCCVVANGKATYERALAHPDEMLQDLEFEALLSLASTAFKEKTGKEYEHDSEVSYESFSNSKGWKPTAATRAGKFTGKDVPPGNRRPA